MNVYALEAKYEFLKLWRMPAYAVPSIVFPVMFYLLFGVVRWRPPAAGPRGHLHDGDLQHVGVIGAALFGFGSASRRARPGWMTLSARPNPPLATLAKLVMAMLFAAIIIALLAG